MEDGNNSITSIYVEEGGGEDGQEGVGRQQQPRQRQRQRHAAVRHEGQEGKGDDDDDEIVFPNGTCTLGEPTDDTIADQIGKDLQEYSSHTNKDIYPPITSLHFNYTEWTKWGAHEICNFMEHAQSLEKITLHFDKTNTSVSSITSTRTLTALGEALANNTTSKIQKLRLFWVKLQHKSIIPFCRFLQNSTSLQKLVLVDVYIDFDAINKFASSIQSSTSLQSISFFNVLNPIVTTILQEMGTVGCPPSLKLLELETSSRPDDAEVPPELDTSGLETLLKSKSCSIEKIKFNAIRFGFDSIKGLHQGLIHNTSLQDLIIRECPTVIKDEEDYDEIASFSLLFQSTLLEMKSVRNLQLDCFPISTILPVEIVIDGLRDNKTLIHCELINLPMGCGSSLQEILTRNSCLKSLKINNSDRVLANPSVDTLPTSDIKCLAEGLRANRTLQTLTLKALGIEQPDSGIQLGIEQPDSGIQYLTEALCCSTTRQDDTAPAPVGGLDLTLHWDSISIKGLDYFSKALRQRSCRLKRLRLELEDTINISLNAGMVRFIEALEHANTTLESVYLDCEDEDCGLLAPPVFARLAHAFLHTSITRLDLCFGMDNEMGWREMDPQIITMIQSDLFVGLAKNYTLERVQFASVMYQSQTSKDKEFWRDVSFFGMRNRLLKGLLDNNRSTTTTATATTTPTISGARTTTTSTATTTTTTISADDITSVVDVQSLARSMIIDEIATHKPWTLRRWKRERDPNRHKLNELSIFFLCLQHLPHLLTCGGGTTTTTTNKPPTTNIKEQQLNQQQKVN